MGHIKVLGTIVLTAVLLVGLLEPAMGQLQPPQVEQNQLDRANPRERQNPRNAEQTNVRISERQAASLARAQFEGNVLRISLVGEGLGRRYQIRMENEGKVFTVFVHATTGQVSGGN